MKGVDVALIVFIVLLVVVLGLWGYTSFFTVEGVLLQPTTQSQASIDVVVNFNPSDNLPGIDFGNIDPPINDVGADHNNDSLLDATSLYIEGGTESTVDLEVCINADGDLVAGGGPFIPLAGETYSTGFNDDQPVGPAGSTSLTTSYVEADGNPIGIGDRLYFRYWLDITDAGQSSGTYLNTINYKVQQDTGVC